jgi:hypothetical protein
MSLADRVAERARAKPVRQVGFFSRLSPEHQAELLEVRRRFQSGGLGSASALADLLIEEAAADGIELCGPQGLRVWLARRD